MRSHWVGEIGLEDGKFATANNHYWLEVGLMLEFPADGAESDRTRLSRTWHERAIYN